jgi:flagellar biosynthesis protein
MEQGQDKSPKKVVGLSYVPGSGLPKVVVKGHGELAERILEYRQSIKGPPIVKDEKLCRQLYKLPMDAEISPDLFELVAMLLVHVFAIENKLADGKNG